MVFRGTGGDQLSLTYKGETVENRLPIGGGGVPLNAKKTSRGSMSKFCDNQNLTLLTLPSLEETSFHLVRGYKPLVTSHIGNGVTIGKRNCVFVFRKCATSKSKNVDSFSQRLALCLHEPALSIVQLANSPYLLLLMLVVRTLCSIKKSNLALMVVDFFFR